MITEVTMKRELFGYEISQKSKSEFFSLTDLSKAGNIWRKKNNLSVFNLSLYLNSKSCKEFINELEVKNKQKPIILGRGRNSQTWAHPLLFIDVALAISPKLKIEVYQWLLDNLIKFRNDSGDSYKEMAGALYMNTRNHRDFPEFISETANKIKKACKVEDWQTATEEQLHLRDRIHWSIKLLCNVLKSPKHAVRLGIKENVK